MLIWGAHQCRFRDRKVNGGIKFSPGFSLSSVSLAKYWHILFVEFHVIFIWIVVDQKCRSAEEAIEIYSIGGPSLWRQTPELKHEEFSPTDANFRIHSASIVENLQLREGCNLRSSAPLGSMRDGDDGFCPLRLTVGPALRSRRAPKGGAKECDRCSAFYGSVTINSRPLLMSISLVKPKWCSAVHTPESSFEREIPIPSFRWYRLRKIWKHLGMLLQCLDLGRICCFSNGRQGQSFGVHVSTSTSSSYDHPSRMGTVNLLHSLYYLSSSGSLRLPDWDKRGRWLR